MRPRRHKRQMSEINVVPYIDVMLVLLVIFMVTAPLLMEGVSVELPQASAKPFRKRALSLLLSMLIKMSSTLSTIIRNRSGRFKRFESKPIL